MKNKAKRQVSNIVLIVICVMIILYTAAAFILQYFTNLEVSSTMTTCWFSFWGAELVALATIKCTKVKNNADYGQVDCSDGAADYYEEE